jgi:hypothetical protein
MMATMMIIVRRRRRNVHRSYMQSGEKNVEERN